MKAWHFTNGKLRDGRPVPAVGEVLRHEGEIVMCGAGLHASKRLFDALGYAPGHTLHRVEVQGGLQHESDKLVGRERVILWTLEADVVEPLLRDFARRCALDVVHLWDAPEVVLEYLKTGNEDLRAAAWDAAWAAAWDAARSAARVAAWDAVWDAVWSAARSAAWDAARSAAWDAARSAARVAAWGAARDTAIDKFNRRLTAMVIAAHKAEG